MFDFFVKNLTNHCFSYLYFPISEISRKPIKPKISLSFLIFARDALPRFSSWATVYWASLKCSYSKTSCQLGGAWTSPGNWIVWGTLSDGKGSPADAVLCEYTTRGKRRVTILVRRPQIIRSSSDHHQIITRSSTDHHQIIIRSSLDHHQIITRSSPDH